MGKILLSLHLMNKHVTNVLGYMIYKKQSTDFDLKANSNNIYTDTLS